MHKIICETEKVSIFVGRSTEKTFDFRVKMTLNLDDNVVSQWIKLSNLLIVV